MKYSVKYDTQVNQMWELGESFQYYFMMAKQLVTSLFKWNGLPNNIPEDFIEEMLFEDGQVGFVHDNEKSYLVAKCQGTNNVDLYNNFNSYHFTAPNYSKVFEVDNCVIIKNNIDCFPTFITVMYFVKRLYTLEQDIRTNLSLQKFPVLVQCEEEQKLSIENLLKQFKGGEPFLLAYKDIDLKGIQVFDTHVPFIADKLNDMRDNTMTQFLSNFGINNANTSKKERLVTDEVNSNNQYLDLQIDKMLEFRQKACEEINEYCARMTPFENIHVTVELREKRNSTIDYKEGGAENE